MFQKAEKNLGVYLGAPTIVAFLLLLVLGGSFLTLNDGSDADKLGGYAFMLLVVGATIHIWRFSET